MLPRIVAAVFVLLLLGLVLRRLRQPHVIDSGLRGLIAVPLLLSPLVVSHSRPLVMADPLSRAGVEA